MKKKLVSTSLVIALLAVAIIGGTLAYFTDTTDTKNNVFTVGNVDIKLLEDKWEPENNHIVPSVSLPKDPTITVEQGSDDAYVFMNVQLNKYASFLKLVGLNEDWKETEVWTNWGIAVTDGSYTEILDKWFVDVDHTKWDIMNEAAILAELNKMATQENAPWLTVEIAYKDVQTAGDKVTLFTAVKIPDTVTSEMLTLSKFNTKDMTWNLNITGKAIQAQGITDYKAAYATLYAE